MAKRKADQAEMEDGLEADIAGQVQNEIRKAPLPRRRFVNEMPDRGLFIVVSMVGFASIVAAKIYEYDAANVAVGAVSLMLLYAVIAFRNARLRLRPDRLGDNFYYLGFIFTLASLSAALIQLQTDLNRIESILGSFGIALVTTIVGIAGRVMFVQMRGEIDEIEAESRRDLLSTSEALRGQLALTLAEFHILQTGMRQASAEIMESTKSLSHNHIEALSKAAQAAANTVEKAFAANSGIAENINIAVSQTLQSAKQITDKVEKMQLPSERLEAEMARLSAEVESMLERLGQLVTTISRERRARESWLSWFLRRRTL